MINYSIYLTFLSVHMQNEGLTMIDMGKGCNKKFRGEFNSFKIALHGPLYTKDKFRTLTVAFILIQCYLKLVTQLAQTPNPPVLNEFKRGFFLELFYFIP